MQKVIMVVILTAFPIGFAAAAGKSCVNRTSCRQCGQYSCVCQQPCREKRPCPPPQHFERREAQAAPPGMFAAPPQAGEAVGESSSFGLRGFAIRFPSLTLELPTIQLPSLLRYRRDAYMQVDEARAPFVTGPAAVYGQVAPGGNALAVQKRALRKRPCRDPYAPRDAREAEARSREARELRQQLLEERRRCDKLEQDLEEIKDCLNRVLAQKQNQLRQQQQLSNHQNQTQPQDAPFGQNYHRQNNPGNVQQAGFASIPNNSPERNHSPGIQREASPFNQISSQQIRQAPNLREPPKGHFPKEEKNRNPTLRFNQNLSDLPKSNAPFAPLTSR